MRISYYNNFNNKRNFRKNSLMTGSRLNKDIDVG